VAVTIDLKDQIAGRFHEVTKLPLRGAEIELETGAIQRERRLMGNCLDQCGLLHAPVTNAAGLNQ
jgi:hypothetical protein